MSEELKFPHPPTWNAKTHKYDFHDVPPEQQKDATEWWMNKYRDLLENDAPGLTNKRREWLSRQYKQLAAFLGKTTKTPRPFRRL